MSRSNLARWMFLFALSSPAAVVATEAFPTGVIRVIYAPAQAPAPAGYDEAAGHLTEE